MSETKKIYGIQFQEIDCYGWLIWRTYIKNPFKQDDNWKIGLNEKFLKTAISCGVKKFILQVGQREILMPAPDEKDLLRKDKAGEFAMQKSLFDGKPPFKIYHFILKT